MRRQLGAACVLVMMLAPFAAAGEFEEPAFPLVISDNKRLLEDAEGRPFLIHGDTAWSLIAELTREETLRYLSDRKKRGFNALVVSLIERKYATNAPANAYGQPPFVLPGRFSRPNDAYFDHAEWVVRQAGEMGFLVLLAPAYLGFNGGEEGWYREMEAAGTDELAAYGRYVGERFGRFKNILWLYGGDYDAADRDLVRAVVEGIASTGAKGLNTVHSAPDTITIDYWPAETWLDLDTVYTYADVHKQVLERYRRGDGKPILMLESTYEGEHGADALSMRGIAYGAMLAGAAGHIFGNNPIWHFSGPGIYPVDVTWQEALSSAGAQSMTQMRTLFEGLFWWALEPVTDRSIFQTIGAEEGVYAAANEDGSLAVAYLPDGAASLLVSGNLKRDRDAQWFDPATGTFFAATESGSESLYEPPSPRNGAGDPDWVLILRAPRE
ncbi:apiosidase-like domain-containing protein [Chelativorans sp. YIM 93263]|uniref:apiosidase-like domain-containing protein n=1 Tax=Chelativorans sp. YIM 93263 TaxID=2906648 RepID=UPI002379428C|nr:DUF4038 domain-containing protein [Chelativorans sp. YIM 93263]